jgi:hypothetical protein
MAGVVGAAANLKATEEEGKKRILWKEENKEERKMIKRDERSGES